MTLSFKKIVLPLILGTPLLSWGQISQHPFNKIDSYRECSNSSSTPLYDSYRRYGSGLNPTGIFAECDAYDYARYSQNQVRLVSEANRALDNLNLVLRDLDANNDRIRNTEFVRRYERHYDGNFIELERRINMMDENLRRQMDDLERDVRRSEQISLRDVPRRLEELQDRQLPQEKAREDQKRSQVSQFENELNRTNTDLNQAQNSLNDLNKKIADLNAAKSNAFDKQKSLDAIKAQNGPKISDLENQIRDLDQRIAAATPEQKPPLEELKAIKVKDLESLKQPIANAEKDALEARKKVDGLQAQLGSDQQIADNQKTLQVRVETLKKQQGDLTKNLEISRAELERMVADTNRTKERIAFLRTVQQRHIENLQTMRDIADVRPLIRTAYEIDRVRAQRQSEYDARRSDADFAGSVVQWVNVNLQNADRVILSRIGATGIANQDAKATAAPRATAEGKTDGEYIGLETGRGKISGTVERGLQHATYDGRSDGADAGRQMKHPVGRAEGTAAGNKDGLARAVETARPEYIKGFDQKESEIRKKVLNNTVIGEDFDGLQKESSDQITREGEGFARRRVGSENLPAEILNDVFIYHFVNVYVPSYDAAYDDVYSETRERISKETESNEKQRLASELSRRLAEQIAEIQANGRSEIFNSARSGKITNNSIEDASENTVYLQHRDKNGRGKKRYDDAFEAENYRVSKETAYKLAEEKTFVDNIEGQKDIFTKQGIAKADELYANNAILEVVKVQMVESEDDGVNRPSEKLSLRLIVKNFGKKAFSALNTVLRTSGAASATKAQNTLTVAAESVVEIRGASLLKVNNDALDGQSFKLVLEATNVPEISYGRAVGEIPVVKSVSRVNTVEDKALYPIKVSVNDFDGLLIPGETKSVEVSLNNRSRKPVSALLTLSGDDSRVNFIDSTLQTQVDAGSSAKLNFRLTGREEARFEETSFNAVARQGNQIYSQNLEVAAVVINRHKTTSESQGLIISSNLAKGGGKFIYKSGNMDTWDLRSKVDGSLNAANVLADYKAKVVHVLVDQNSSFDAATLATLNAYVQSGGTVTVWGSSLASLELGKALGLGIEGAREVNLNNGLVGVQSFRTLRTARVGGSALALNIDQTKNGGDRKRVFPAIKLDDGTIVGTLSFRDSRRQQTDKPGRVLTLGLRAEDLSSQPGLIAQLNEATRLAGLGFGEKMNLARKTPAMQFLVLEDIKAEMRSMDVERDDEVYKGGFDSDDRSKLSKALELLKYVSKKGDDRTQDAVRIAFAKLYVEAYQAGDDMYQTPFKYGGRMNAGKMMDEKQVRVRDGGFFSKKNESWKMAYEAVGNL